MWDELASQIEFELGQLQKLVDLFRPVVDSCALGEPGRLDVAALGAMLHSFYGGVENIFKRISLGVDGALPSGDAWHSALLKSMADPSARRGAVISPWLAGRLREYLEFRHVFRSVYAFLLTWHRMAPLVRDCEGTFQRLRDELGAFVRKLTAEM